MSEQLGEFSLKHTGTTYGRNAAGELTNSVNWEGTASGFGAVWGTLFSATPLSDASANGGSVEWAGQAFLEDGTVLGALGKGTWEKPQNEHKWKIVMHVDLSTGEKQRAEGEIDLETLMYEGKIYSVD